MQNKKISIIKVLAVLFLIGLSFQSYSQRLSVFKVPKFKRDHTLNYLMASGGIGMSNYFGDLCSDYSCWTFQHSASLGVYWRYNTRFAFRGEFYWSRLTGADKKYDNPRKEDPRFGRNASFRTDIFELSVGAMYDIFDFNPNYAKRANFEPYLHASIGILNFNPMAQYTDGAYYNLREFKTEGKTYSNWAVSFPIGAGCRFKVTDKLNVGVEIGYRITTTDYLDDVSSFYRKDRGTITDPKEAYFADRGAAIGVAHNPGDIRGNPANRDGYIVYSLKVEYLLFVTQQLNERGKNINADIDPRYKKRQIRRR